MGFIDGEERNRHAAKPGGCAVEGDALRREIEKAVVALAGAAEDEAARGRSKRAIEKTGGDAHLFELRDLVLIKAISGETTTTVRCALSTAGNW